MIDHDSRTCLVKIHLTKLKTGKEHELGKGKAKRRSLKDSGQAEVILSEKKKLHTFPFFLSHQFSNYLSMVL